MNVSRGYKETGTGAISISKQFGHAVAIKEIRLTLDAFASDLNEFTIGLDSELGSNYDHVLNTPDPDEDLSSVTNYRYADIVPPIILPEDSLVVSWPNSGGCTWAIEIIISK